jgi:hypothetical protein
MQVSAWFARRIRVNGHQGTGEQAFPDRRRTGVIYVSTDGKPDPQP